MKQEYICKICKKSFYKTNNSKGIYCSLKCSYSDKDRMKSLATNTERSKKLSLKLKGRKFSKEHIEKLKQPRTEKTKEKMRKMRKGNWAGDKNPKWKNGISKLTPLIRGCFKYRQWRSDIFHRDIFTCILCGDKRGGNLEADHYPKKFSDVLKQYDIKTIEEALSCEELWDINNGRTLCKECHKKTPTYAR